MATVVEPPAPVLRGLLRRRPQWGSIKTHEAGRETALNASAGAAPWHTNERADLPARTRGRAWIVVPICVKALLKLPNLRYAEGGEDAIPRMPSTTRVHFQIG
jgi:hypothetical protein